MRPVWLDVLRLIVVVLVLLLLYFSQRFWFLGAWRKIARVRRAVGKSALRVLWGVALLVVLVTSAAWLFRPRPRDASFAFALLGLWLSSAFLACVAVQLVKVLEWGWSALVASRGLFSRRTATESAASRGAAPDPPGEAPADPSRRYFFQSATYLAGAVPFVGTLYGFLLERLHYRVDRVEVPIPNLPAALDGLRIAQLSDIHIGTYMPRAQVRRAVAMANELGAHLATVTGDFITGASDPLESCVEELAELRAPLGVWGCLGNHEIYADAEDYATELFRRVGVRVLRRANAKLAWHGQAFNLIGVDYQRERAPSGRRLPMLSRVEPLVRRDVPNILLSHNPNAFPRAAELGIELTLAGHTHGGQVQVEILDHRWSPARFFTDFVAGLYRRQVTSGEWQVTSEKDPARHPSPATGHAPLATAFLYVNRGLGTIGAPVRLNSPPEITLLVLRRA